MANAPIAVFDLEKTFQFLRQCASQSVIVEEDLNEASKSYWGLEPFKTDPYARQERIRTLRQWFINDWLDALKAGPKQAKAYLDKRHTVFQLDLRRHSELMAKRSKQAAETDRHYAWAINAVTLTKLLCTITIRAGAYVVPGGAQVATVYNHVVTVIDKWNDVPEAQLIAINTKVQSGAEWVAGKAQELAKEAAGKPGDMDGLRRRIAAAWPLLRLPNGDPTVAEINRQRMQQLASMKNAETLGKVANGVSIASDAITTVNDVYQVWSNWQ